MFAEWHPDTEVMHGTSLDGKVCTLLGLRLRAAKEWFPGGGAQRSFSADRLIQGIHILDAAELDWERAAIRIDGLIDWLHQPFQLSATGQLSGLPLPENTEESIEANLGDAKLTLVVARTTRSAKYRREIDFEAEIRLELSLQKRWFEAQPTPVAGARTDGLGPTARGTDGHAPRRRPRVRRVHGAVQGRDTRLRP